MRRVMFGLFAAMLPAGVHAQCEGIVSPARAANDGPRHGITARDLIELREIGNPDPADFSGPSALAVSPDGKQVAFIVNQADLVSNGYCRALLIVTLGQEKKPIVADRGGELIQVADIQRGYYLPSGSTTAVTPVWSPDGSRLAYLRRDKGVTQAWIADVRGNGARAVSHSVVDVDAVAWSADGRRLIFASRRGRAAAEEAIDLEGQAGWLYDDRIGPQISPRPMARASSDRDIFIADPAGGGVHLADQHDAAHMLSILSPPTPKPPSAVTSDGRWAATERRSPSPLSPAAIYASGIAGAHIPCTDAACADGIVGLWWADSGRTVVFLRREGWAKGEMALYRWRVGKSPPSTILRTSDLLHGCVLAAPGLLCTRENSSLPRRISAVDIRTGAVRDIFDPNPEFASVRLGTVERIKWRNDIGFEAWGDLVLPPDYKPGSRVPLVVVQYHSDGFLRGGTGDEYPIFLLAARGIAVLSTERPTFYGSKFPELKSWNELNAIEQKDWNERRSLLSSVETGVRIIIDRGLVDPSRIGISGMSDGATTVAFALINSRTFRVAAISSCCIEPKTTMTYGGIAWADSLRSMGYPPASNEDRAFWQPMSLAQNARAIDTPLLMQLADDEYLLALETFSALREQHKPVEMYVFPHEYHVKWQPAHRLAVYGRNLDWFDFWLQDREDPDAAKTSQYRRWRSMRALKPGVLVERP